MRRLIEWIYRVAFGLYIRSLEQHINDLTAILRQQLAERDKLNVDIDITNRRLHLATCAQNAARQAIGPGVGIQKSGSARETQAVSGDITTAAAADSCPSGKHDLPVSEAANQAQAGCHGPEEVPAGASGPAASAPLRAATP